MNKVLLEEKWNKLLGLIDRFKHIPFIDFVLVAGSMAMNNVHENSDFDLIIGTQSGRIFTVRQFSAGFFQIGGHRRKGIDEKHEAKDKICLNHFVTPESYRLDPPYNEYWKDLYNNLVPVYGDKLKIEKFFKENDWAGDIDVDYGKWQGNKKSFFRKFLELTLYGFTGNLQEKLFKTYQINRIEKNLDDNLGYKPQVKYDDDEIRFHMDTKRIEEYLDKK